MLLDLGPELAAAAAHPGSNFTLLDWGVVLGYFLLTTLLGARLAGKPATIRDFFLGGRKLPWYAVAGSIVATEISAVTFVSVPFVVFKPGGDFTYLQLGLIGSFLARVIIGYVLIPAYYRREIYSPYDYMGNRLGSGVRGVTSALFALGGVLAQSARVYITAIVLDLVLGPTVFAPLEQATGIDGLAWSIWTIGVIAVLWTLMGGITTVIWTDVILFGVFLIGALAAVVVIASRLDGGFAEMIAVGQEAGKFRFFDWDPDPTRAYTVWTAAIAATWGGVGAYGTDQLMAQRMFCCRSAREARLAVISSTAGQVVTFLVMVVGAGLYAFYRAHPLSGEALASYQEKGDRIFPIFIINEIPPGLTGLIIAGIFAAAVSSLDSILAALSQTVMSAIVLPLRRRSGARSGQDEKRDVLAGRLLVVFWGVVLCLAAQLADKVAAYYPSILDLALAMAGYAGGGLLAGFLLSFLRLPINGYGYLWSAPLSVLFVFALVWHQEWTAPACWAGGAVLLLSWLLAGLRRGRRPARFLAKTALLAAGVVLVLLVNHYGQFVRAGGTGEIVHVSIAWPWYAPIGCTVAFVFGWLLADRAPRAEAD